MSKHNKAPKNLECYACSQLAVSWEHAPPKGFYPRRQEVYGVPKEKDYRRGLITVPSCDDHNTAKSGDDNFVQAAIIVFAAIYGNHFDQIEPHPFALKAIRRVQNGPRLRRVLIEDADIVSTPYGEMIAVKPEVNTIRRTLELTARALYYHEHDYRRRWPDACVVDSPHFVMSDLSAGPRSHVVDYMLTAFTGMYRAGHKEFELKGPHPDAFAYQFLERDEVCLMRMTFYGGFHFVAYSEKLPAPTSVPK